MANQRDKSVNNILEEIKQKQNQIKNTSTLSVDEILAEMGMRQAADIPAKPAPPKPVAPPKPAPQPVQPAPTPVAAPQPPQPQAQSAPQPQVETPAPAPKRTNMGKAAALDLVDPDKFNTETELLSWFEQDDSIPMSKREQRQADKARKKQEAALRKEEKRLRKQGYTAPQEEEWEEESTWAGQAADTYEEYDGYEPEAEADADPDATYYEPYEEEAPQDNYHTYGAAPEEEYSGDDAGGYFEQEESPAAPEYASYFEPAPVAEATPPEPASYFEQQPEPELPPAEEKPPAKDFKLFETQELQFPISITYEDTAEPPAWDGAAIGSYDAPWEPQEEWPEDGSLFDAGKNAKKTDTQIFTPLASDKYPKVPPADFTQEFDSPQQAAAADKAPKTLYVDDLVDDRFREFFSETVSVDREDEQRNERRETKRLGRSQLLTGEFSKLGTQAGIDLNWEDDADERPYEDNSAEEYRHPKDAPVIMQSINRLQKSLLVRLVANAVLAALLFWLGAAGKVPLPGIVNPTSHPLGFGITYLILVLATIVLNFSTIAPGIVGLFGEPTVDTGPALSMVTILLQAVVVLVQLLASAPINGTLMGGIAALLLAGNALGKYLRARAIRGSFQLASQGVDHSSAYAGYVLDYNNEIALDVTQGLNEDYPAVLVSRPTALVKGFMRQSFSPRWSDGIGRVVGWILFGVALLCGIFTYVQSKQLLPAVSAMAAALCLATPLTSSLTSGLPSLLLQRSTAKVGAAVPGWSAVEELGQVNVVMANANDIFPPASVSLHGLRAFELQNINNAILYAASVIIEGCDTLKDIFLALINGKTETLYKVESLIYEPGRGYTAWVDGKRIVLGTREMLQKHDITPPSVETEMQYINAPGRRPIYLAVSGKLYGMFVVGYTKDEGVQGMLDGLVQSGVSLLVTSDDMNIDQSLIEEVYHLPSGIVKVLGHRELELLEPLTGYLDESEGVMTHIGSFTSFIGGMRAAAACAVSERMCAILQIVSAGFGCFLCFVLAMFEGLANISIFPVLLFQVAWAIVALAIPLTRQR